MKKTILWFVVMLLSGCSWLRPAPIIQTKTIEVKVPVYLKAEVPEFLQNRQKFDLPAFKVPGSEGMSSCLNLDGEAKLKHLMIELEDRERAWQEFTK